MSDGDKCVVVRRGRQTTRGKDRHELSRKRRISLEGEEILLGREGCDINHLTPVSQVIPRSQALHCHFTHIKLSSIRLMDSLLVQQNAIQGKNQKQEPSTDCVIRIWT